MRQGPILPRDLPKPSKDSLPETESLGRHRSILCGGGGRPDPSSTLRRRSTPPARCGRVLSAGKKEDSHKYQLKKKKFTAGKKTLSNYIIYGLTWRHQDTS